MILNILLVLSDTIRHLPSKQCSDSHCRSSVHISPAHRLAVLNFVTCSYWPVFGLYSVTVNAKGRQSLQCEGIKEENSTKSNIVDGAKVREVPFIIFI